MLLWFDDLNPLMLPYSILQEDDTDIENASSAAQPSPLPRLIHPSAERLQVRIRAQVKRDAREIQFSKLSEALWESRGFIYSSYRFKYSSIIFSSFLLHVSVIMMETGTDRIWQCWVI